MTDKLRECPFCEGEAAIWEISRKKKRYAVSCYRCSCATDEMETREEAIKAWNTRKPMDRIVEQLENASCYIKDGDGHAGHVVFTDKAIAIVKGVQNG